jgi:ubiquitin C-terminal hydrolase
MDLIPVINGYNHQKYTNQKYIPENIIRTYIGISNPGNTCYLNSILQILLSLDSFNNELIKNVNISNKDYIDFFHDYISMILFCRRKPKSMDDTISISKFIDNEHVLDIDNFKFNFDKLINGGLSNDQHDAHEIMIKILELLHEVLKTERPYIVNKMFRGQTQSKIICKNCNTNTFTFSTFMNLSVYIDENVHDVSSAIDQCILPEYISEFHCQYCNRFTSADKVTSFSRLPNYLIIHMNRFKPVSTEFGIEYSKNNQGIKLNQEIVIEQTHYVIKGAIFHHSGCINYGHYTSVIFVRELGYRCIFINDDEITVSDWNDNILKNNTYLVIYEKANAYPNRQRFYSF